MHYVKKCFSLAELMLTMTIVGSIASFTIPVLIQNIQDTIFKIAYKEKLSAFSQAFTRMRMDNGGTLENIFINGNSSSFETPLRKYMNIINFSHTHRSETNKDWLDYCYYKYLNGDQGGDYYRCSGCPAATFADGSFFMLNLSWSDNDLTVCNRGGDFPREGLCFNVMLDVNGKKAPNTLGKDIFILAVYKDKTVPADWAQTGAIDISSCTPSGTGAGCAIKYMMQ